MDLSDLFSDLEQQLGTELELEFRDQLTDDERSRQAKLDLRERIRLMCQPRGIASREPLHLILTGGTQLSVSPMTHGRDWIAADVETSMGVITHAVIPLAAVATLHPTPSQLTRSVGEPVTSISRDDVASLNPARARLTDQIGLPYVLRDLSRRRKPVELITVTAGYLESRPGVIERVGRDHLDLVRADRLEIIPLAHVQLVYLT